MRLQMASRLAIYSVLELASNPDATLSAAKIGEKYGVSTHHLTRVLRTLGRAGLVSATRGVGGGYQFCGNPKRTTLLDIIELFETVGEPRNDRAGPDGLTPEDRVLGAVLGEIDDIVHATLDSITIATMLRLVDDRRQAETQKLGDDRRTHVNTR